MNVKELSENLKKILPEHKASLTITHNEHKNYYESVEQFLETDELGEWVSEEERLKSLKTDEIWEIQWYPDTPVGFCLIRASTLEACLSYFYVDNRS